MLSSLLFSCWLGHILTCYYFIRSISSTFIRIHFTIIPCVLLTYYTSRNLPEYEAVSSLIIILSWMISIRLVHLTIFATDKQLTFRSFIGKVFWMLFPVLPIASKRNEWPIKYYFILIVSKVLFSHWIYRCLLMCETGVSYGRVLMFYGFLTTTSHPLDVAAILVRILSGNRYTVESFTNFPLFSLSVREFWGQRYNRILGTILKESIFEPIRSIFSSPTIAGLTTFVVSGLLHIHIAFIIFGGTSFLLSTFLLFLIHGLACSLETKVKIQFPKYIQLLLTFIFLLLTAPLSFEPSLRKESPFLLKNPPPLYNVNWIPKLPVPCFCL